MLFKDFVFLFTQSITRDVEKKLYFKSLRKIFNLPYKYFLDIFRQFFLINKIDLDKNVRKSSQNKLDDLFKEFNSDKGSKFLLNGNLISGHNYSPFYEKYFEKFKLKKNLNILEIGSLRGSSAASFYHYFNNPNIYCLDINPFQIQIFSKKIRKVFVDSQSKKILKNTIKFLNTNFDIIIDDGSHNIRDQIITLSAFLPNLNNKGIYVIEDISQYLVSSNLNPDNLPYGIKGFLLNIKSEQNLFNYLTEEEKFFLRDNIFKKSFEKGQFMLNNINISEIAFIEKS